MSHKNKNETNYSALTFITGSIIGTGAFLFFRWKVSKPHQYLVKSGAFTNGKMKIGRSLIQLPFQEISVIDMYPHTYQFSLHNMSKEKVEFNLPVVFTVGPVSPEENQELFLKYCSKLNELYPDEVENIIKGMIEGETRTLTANMTIEEMFSSKETFRNEVVEKIAKDLEAFGLKIYNANIKEMTDYDEKNKYFEYRKKRAIETANYEAQASVAKAQREGESNVAIEESINRQNKAKAQMEAQLVENENKIKEAESLARLSQAQAESQKIKQVAFVEAEQATKQREIELQTMVDKQRHLQMIEAERAKYLATAMAEAEALERKSQAELIQAQNQAQGILASYQATAEGLEKVIQACGDIELAKFALALDKRLYQDLTHEMAQGLQGMKPNVTIIGNQGNNMLSPYVESAYQMAPFLKEMLGNLNLTENKKMELTNLLNESERH
jgi:flotillin